MIWKTLVVAFLAVGVLAQLEVTDEQRQLYKEALREICKKNGAEDKVDEVEGVVKSFVDCVKELFDLAAIEKEVNEAKPRGALDEVFKKYCEKTPQLKTCINTLTSGIAPCIDASLRQQISTSHNATDSLLDFICYKDGDRIALFIAEGGPECLVDKRPAMQECGQKLKESLPSLEAAKNLTLPEQCAKYDELSECLVKALEGCSTPTPGNMAESMLRYIRNSSPCGKKE